MVVRAINPQMDFSWLGNLPGQIRTARDESNIRETLADLDINDPMALSSASRRLLGGGAASRELAVKLEALGRQREQMQLEKDQLAYHRANLGGEPMPGPATQGPVTPAPEGAPYRGEQPGPLPPLPAPGIGGAGPGMPAQQLPQAPPPRAAPARPTGLGALAGPSDEERAIGAEIGRLTAAMPSIKNSPSTTEAYKQRLEFLRGKLKEFEDRREETYKSGLRMNENEAKNDSDARFATAKTWGEKADRAMEMVPTLNLLEKMFADNEVATGRGLGLADKASNLLAGVNSLAQQFGAGMSDEKIASITNPIARRDLARSMFNQIVHKAVGNLGSGFSGADLIFVKSQFPDVDANSPQANLAMVRVAKALAERTQQISEITEEYQAQPGQKTQAGLRKRIAEYARQNPMFVSKDGEYTELGNTITRAKRNANVPPPERRQAPTDEGRSRQWPLRASGAPKAPEERPAAQPALPVPRPGELMPGTNKRYVGPENPTRQDLQNPSNWQEGKTPEPNDRVL